MRGPPTAAPMSWSKLLPPPASSEPALIPVRQLQVLGQALPHLLTQWRAAVGIVRMAHMKMGRETHLGQQVVIGGRHQESKPMSHTNCEVFRPTGHAHADET